MESSRQMQSRMELEQQLVKDMEAMCDALTKLSLLMHDLDFLVDGRRRENLQPIAFCAVSRGRSISIDLRHLVRRQIIFSTSRNLGGCFVAMILG